MAEGKSKSRPPSGGEKTKDRSRRELAGSSTTTSSSSSWYGGNNNNVVAVLVAVLSVVVAVVFVISPPSSPTSSSSSSSSTVESSSSVVSIDSTSPPVPPLPSHAPPPPSSTCSLDDDGFAYDPNVKVMEFDIGYGRSEFRAYVPPDVSTYYRELPGSRIKKTPRHNGWAAKFVNVSPRKVRLHWDPNDGRPGSPMGTMGPFESTGTASFPGHAFYVTYEDEDEKGGGRRRGDVVARFVVRPPTSVYYYDDVTVVGDDDATRANMDRLSPNELSAYVVHVDTRKFNDRYMAFTGREYLALYPRSPPVHKMWPASYFGQEHWVTTRETHFVSNPPVEMLGPVNLHGSARIVNANGPLPLYEYRDDANDRQLNMTLRVISCSPRAFEIDDFLSQSEVDHIMYLTTGMKLHRSTTASGSEKDADAVDGAKDTRTSLNTWVYREKDVIIDTIYRRAADLLRIDEALLRPRSDDEYPDMASKRSIAEALQLVHYDVGQEYTAHHDFGYSKVSHKVQSARFATLLLYLNEGMEGGATQFPRWVNAETSEGLNVEPKVGKAVLFYSQLPDGNMDDWSHHAALPVKRGEKWLMNLWVWDPQYE